VYNPRTMINDHTPRPMTEGELIALSALVMGCAVEVLATNKACEHERRAPVYGNFDCREAEILRRELVRRGVLRP